MIYELRRGGFALFLRINHSGTLYSQWDTGFSGFVGRDKIAVTGRTLLTLYYFLYCINKIFGVILIQISMLLIMLDIFKNTNVSIV